MSGLTDSHCNKIKTGALHLFVFLFNDNSPNFSDFLNKNIQSSLLSLIADYILDI